MQQTDHDGGQSEVLAFLGLPDAYPNRPAVVERMETHGALVFLAGDEVYKIKRAVRFSYMDFSTLELRRAAVFREIEVNLPHAPELYLDAVAITRGPGGKLAIGGGGEVVEWAVHMRRFPQSDLLGAIASRGELTAELARGLADTVYRSHQQAPRRHTADADAALAGILGDLDRNLASVDVGHSTFRHQEFQALAERQLRRAAGCLRRRGQAGFVRRCHGDLHLDNLVMWRGQPVLFDAIEFNEQFATIDTLYDLAFLLMDLDHRQQRQAANVVLNRYLWRSQAAADIEGLVALPLFLGLRSAVRGLVGAQRAMQRTAAERPQELARARSSLDDALRYLAPRPAQLVAVGGLSGTGKTTLATALAPRLGSAPGAFHIRTDLERKAAAGIAETERLPPAAYTPEASARIYRLVLDKARAALQAGHSVVVDAVFSKQHERAAIEELCDGLQIPFTGLWLDAPAQTMLARVGARVADASDADRDVIERQLAYDIGAIDWQRIDAGGGAEATLQAASDRLQH